MAQLRRDGSQDAGLAPAVPVRRAVRTSIEDTAAAGASSFAGSTGSVTLTRRPEALLAGHSIDRRSTRCCASRSAGRARCRWSWSRSTARTRAPALRRSMPTPVSRRRSSTTRVLDVRGVDASGAPAPGIAWSAFSTMLASARVTSVRIDEHLRQRPAARRSRSRCGPRGPARYGSTTSATSAGRSTGARRAVGDEAKLENSAAICRSSRTCPRIDVDAALEHRAERLAAVGVHAAQVLGRELDRRQRILDLVRHLARHLGPRLEAVRPFELRRAAPSAPPPCC